jgi:hypothetical protein
MKQKTQKELWQIYRFEFEGEEGLDAGGVAREFYETVRHFFGDLCRIVLVWIELCGTV